MCKEFELEVYKNIQNGNNTLSLAELEVAIKAAELARAGLKVTEQNRLREEMAGNLAENVVYIPEKTKKIKPYAYYDNTSITKVVFQGGSTEIGAYAFSGCVNLREICFLNGNVTLRNGCFQGCVSLKEIHIPEVRTIGPSAFKNCTSLETVSLSADVFIIYSGAFQGCIRLRAVHFDRRNYWQGGTLQIYPRAFEDCVLLETIEFPHNRGFIDKTAFRNCRNLKTIYCNVPPWEGIRLVKCEAEIKDFTK